MTSATDTEPGLGLLSEGLFSCSGWDTKYNIAQTNPQAKSLQKTPGDTVRYLLQTKQAFPNGMPIIKLAVSTESRAAKRDACSLSAG